MTGGYWKGESLVLMTPDMHGGPFRRVPLYDCIQLTLLHCHKLQVQFWYTVKLVFLTAFHFPFITRSLQVHTMGAFAIVIRLSDSPCQ